MSFRRRLLLSLWFILPAIPGVAAELPFEAPANTATPAAENQPAADHDGDYLSPYSVYDICEDDDEDDGLPLNEIEIRYNDARMAFLFGQFEVAYKAWVPLANVGYAKAQAAIAWMYHTGNGVDKDMNKAIEWYKKAALQGHPIAQNNLGVFFENGTNVPVNEKVAVDWYRNAAESGYSYAQYNLGRMYAEGRGVKQNLKEARYWWQIASRQRVKQASEALALLDKKTNPVAQQPKHKPSVAHAPYHSSPVSKARAWIRSQPRHYYTIQLARNKDANRILKLAESAKDLEQPLIQFDMLDENGVNWHTLVYGSFSNYQEAEAARRMLPGEFRKWNPWLRRMGDLQNLLKTEDPSSEN